MTTDARFGYVTTQDAAEALKIGRALVAERLAACANVSERVTSVYWWEGRVEEGSKAVLVLKSRARLVSALTARVKELYSYSCPCVVALPIDGGNDAYLAWIADETKDSGGG